MVDFKTMNYQKCLSILALAGAMWAANGSGDLLAYTGIAYYILCVIGLLANYQRVNLMLWTAVGVHIGLTSFAIWRWQVIGIIPCHFCLLAAGCALVAAVIYSRPKLVVLPLILMVSVAYAWPNIFIVENNPGYVQTGSELSGPNDTNDQKPEAKQSANQNNINQETQTSIDKPSSTKQTTAEAGPSVTSVKKISSQPASSAERNPSDTSVGKSINQSSTSDPTSQDKTFIEQITNGAIKPSPPSGG